MGRSRHKPAVQRYHDRVAGRYDTSYDDPYWQWHDALTWEYLKPFLPSNLSYPVLDLGCGTGKWGVKLLRSGYRVTFVDISHAMLDQVRHALAEAPDVDRAEFFQADLMNLGELPAEAFSLAVAFGEPIGCTEHPAKAIKEIRRRLRPEGLLAATFDNKFNAIDYYLQGSPAQELEDFLRSGRTHWLTRDKAEQFPIHTQSPGEVRKLLEQAGFDVVDLVGKTVLPMRHHREKLQDPEERNRLMRIERSLCRDPAAMGRAAHVQATARVAT